MVTTVTHQRKIHLKLLHFDPECFQRGGVEWEALRAELTFVSSGNLAIKIDIHEKFERVWGVAEMNEVCHLCG